MNKYLYILFLIWLYLIPQEVISAEQEKHIPKKFEGLNGRTLVDSVTSLMIRQRNNAPEEMIEYGKYAYKIADKNGDLQGKAKLLDELGVLYRKVSDYAKALGYHFKALRLYEQLNDRVGISFVYTNIGNVYYSIQNNEVALSYFFKSLKIKEELQDTFQIGYTANRIGLAYFNMSEYDSSETYYLLSAKIMREFKDELRLANVYNNLGNVEIAKQNYIGGLSYLKKAEKKFRAVNSLYGLTVTLNSLADLCLKTNKPVRAVTYLEEGKNYVIQLKSKSLDKDYSYLFYKYFKSVGDDKKALEYLERHDRLSDEIFNIGKINLVSQAESVYYIEKEENQNKILKQQNKIDALEIENQKISIYFLVISILLIAAFIGIIIKRNMKINVINSELNEQKEKLSLANKELERNDIQKNKFFSIISHDLKNPFHFLINSASLMKSEYANLTDEEKLELIKSIEKVSSESFDLLKNLQEWVSLQSGKTVINKSEINIAKTAGSNLSLLDDIAARKNISFENKINDDIYGIADAEMLSTVFRNIISNSLKFSNPGGKIEINAVEENDYIKISIRDEGIGMDKEQNEKLFKPGESISRKGTAEEKGSGLGLLLCKDIIDETGGKIWAESIPGKGSIFYFTIPRNKNSGAEDSHQIND